MARKIKKEDDLYTDKNGKVKKVQRATGRAFFQPGNVVQASARGKTATVFEKPIKPTPYSISIRGKSMYVPAPKKKTTKKK